MKRSLFILFVTLPFLLLGQTSQKPFSFQGYAVDANGKPLSNTDITVRFTIYSPSQGTQYQEEQQLGTDIYGVFTTLIGIVTPSDFSKLDFTQAQDYKLRVEVRRTDGGTYNTVYDTELPAVAFARYAYNGVPVGTIVPFAGPKNKIPDGWLLCDGRALDINDYPQLFNVIGYTWGGSGSTFYLPDLRGMFLRGVDDGAGNDPDAGSRYAKVSGGNTGDNVGSYQGDEFKSHQHTGTTDEAGGHTHSVYFDNGGGGTASVPSAMKVEGQTCAEQTNVFYDTKTTTSNNGSHTHTFTTDASGGNETRPKNAYVFYIIKY